jgi:drug/metabolite transporter (DMT)-like permease
MAAPTTTRHRFLLVLLILSWAISWPVIKVGVATAPPLWYACLRYGIAAAACSHLSSREAMLRFRHDRTSQVKVVTAAISAPANGVSVVLGD